MVIELRGVEFVNKGAELMMLAIISKLKKELTDPLFVMEKSYYAPRNKHLEYGIYTKTNFKSFKIPFKYFFAFVPYFLRKRWRYINENEIDVVLDASGFAYSDVWGPRSASNRLGNFIAKWKADGKKVIMLPQAFGPFADEKLVQVMKTIINYADLIYVRDQISFNHLNQLSKNNTKFILAPDFTNLVNGIVPAYFNNAECQVAIIVNSKMIETSSPSDGEAYVDLLYRIITMIDGMNYKPFFLIHEAKKDTKVAEAINNKLVNKLPVINEANPLYVKGIISKCEAVVTSRFHGLVSCLCQSIPCLATGWSHKYEMLLKDYNYSEALLDIHCNNELLSEKVKSILAKTSQDLIVKNLKDMSAKQKVLSEKMWQNVINIIGE